ncbi:FAD-dependent oxidoreductase [Cellulomonas sp. APG4]|uniref:CoA-disulfide reductase n=1 Tax=Cellulomonas carbonis T26 TaxID=947969 RepID=A0A0A0BYM6_9CELL|nr:MULTISPECIES: FAD-dependent oxidoreductase [Cellulomonas]KGM12772.1 CoA-disulfide reductase [Cellulomonas carbonis T26]NCT89513.1 FAD-dependent oxidoreductase [Cellulomonas sp. APG4]GGC14358.1 putative pyridine nucleotide-disulphide oxidoreductase [Cellulomonas carbonis]
MRLIAVGGSDAGISAALRARELDPTAEVTVVLADEYPNFSICGIPYYVSGEVGHWRNLAHRTLDDLCDAGLDVRVNTRAVGIDVSGRRLLVDAPDGRSELPYDALVVGTGAVPVRPPVTGLDALGPTDGVHLLHTIGDTLALTADLDSHRPSRALIVGAGYVGLEMAEGLTARGIDVVQVEALPEVLPTVDPTLGAVVREELTRHGVEVHTATTVTEVTASDGPTRLSVHATGANGQARWDVDLVLVVVGVRPDTELLVAAGATTGPRGAVSVERDMSTGLPGVWAAGDCVTTHHRLLGLTYLPLGTTAHKQGRVAGENALGGSAVYPGSLGTQVVKVFDLVIARTGLRDSEAAEAGFAPATVQSTGDDHKAYYPGAKPVTIRVIGDTATGRLLGAQLVGTLGAEIAKRVDVYATALTHEMRVADVDGLDLSYTPPLGSPWDVVQTATMAWVREHDLDRQRAALTSRRTE